MCCDLSLCQRVRSFSVCVDVCPLSDHFPVISYIERVCVSPVSPEQTAAEGADAPLV